MVVVGAGVVAMVVVVVVGAGVVESESVKEL